VPGGRGQFDVIVDDELVFSKQAAGRFPEDDEILSRL
jgi:selT/selW/selH-like putative selenoprotein